jgi:hypothetical protein
MSDRILLTISSDLFDDEADQEASVRRNLQVRTLVAEIRKEFSLPEGMYTLRDKSGIPLELEKTLEQCGVQTGAILVFSRERRAPIRQMMEGDTDAILAVSIRAMLRDVQTGMVFEIRHQPAIIGRPDTANPDSAASLAVNLGSLPEGKSVSRQHARITERGGQYYVESLSEHNPTSTRA